MKVPFSPPYITEEAIAEVVDVLRSGWITTRTKDQTVRETFGRVHRRRQGHRAEQLDECL